MTNHPASLAYRHNILRVQFAAYFVVSAALIMWLAFSLINARHEARLIKGVTTTDIKGGVWEMKYIPYSESHK